MFLIFTPVFPLAKRRERLASIEKTNTLKSESQPNPEAIPTESDSDGNEDVVVVNAITSKVVPTYQLDIQVEGNPGRDVSPDPSAPPEEVQVEGTPGRDVSPDPSAPPEEYLEPVASVSRQLVTQGGLESENIDSTKEPQEVVLEIEGERVEGQKEEANDYHDPELYLPVIY